MAAFESAAPGESARRQDGKTAGVRPAVIGLVVAAVIVAAALVIGASSGWEAIGSGGINQRLLPKVGDAAPDFVSEDVYGNP
ncbi:MAG: hypothetical protein ACRDJC_19335, partial [Thermomicrobiales bacterium]